jgi:GAF domain-containing protein
VAARTDEISSGLEQLAAGLLDDVERIAERSMARMKELLPGYAEVPAEELLPVTLANTRNVLEAVLDPHADPSQAEDHFRSSGQTLIRQGITADDLLEAWRIGMGSLREEAHTVADRMGIPDNVLLEFVEATLQWGDLGMRISAQAYREAEFGELAALRRVATLLAQDVPSSELFNAVAREVGTLLGVDYAGVIRYEPGTRFITRMATWSAVGELPSRPSPVQTTVPGDLAAMVADTGKPARVDDWANVPGPMAGFARQLEAKSSVASPIVVEGSLWGAFGVHSKSGPLPPDTESRLLSFTELVATAIANVHAREQVRELAEEQAALRRVATLVAQGAPPSAVFDAVAGEMTRVLGADGVTLSRYEPGDEATVVAHRGADADRVPPGVRVSHADGESVTAKVWRNHRPARFVHGEGAPGAVPALAQKMGVRAAVGAPIVVDGRLWGVAVANWRGEEPPGADTEERMAKFAELVATAISNVEAREEVQWLAQEQAALRRVATMVAQGGEPDDVFDAVAAEVARLLGLASGAIFRFEPDRQGTVVGISGEMRDAFPVGSRWPLDADSVIAQVYRTEGPARGDRRGDGQSSGSMANAGYTEGVRSAVGTPVVVNGRLWGAIGAVTSVGGPLPGDAEAQIAQFAELLATAIANTDSLAQLTASRARLVTEADEARRRVVRDLHDGAQQRLVHAIVTLNHAQRALQSNDEKLESLIAAALDRAEQGYAELHELAHGILPAVLIQGGLRSGINTIVSRLDLPVEVDIPATRFPAEIEASAYFVVAEALTNVVKHSRAGRAEVKACVDGEVLRVEVRDDGVGGVDPHGHGLVGLADRVSALGGRLEVQSPAGGGTLLSALLPLSIG